MEDKKPIKRRKRRPRFLESEKNKEIEKVDLQIDALTQQMSALDQDTINKAPIRETEPQTLMTKAQEKYTDAPVIKPTKSMSAVGKPIPKQAKARKEGWEYVKVIAEHNELIGENIELWINPFAGDPCSYWEIPTNKPIYIPRFLAEHLATRNYHRLKMQDRPATQLTAEMHSDGMASQPSGQFVAKETIRRIDCRRVGFSF